MSHLPLIPSWDALHPLIIHFPIALLFLAPLFILLSAALSTARGRPYMVAGLIVLVLGTGSLFFAASTGEAAGELADRSDAINTVLHAHEALASQTKVVFTGLLALLLAVFFTPRFLRKPVGKLFSRYLPLIFVGLYSAGLILLVQTAHQGGRLVHELGVHALMPQGSTPSVKAPASGVEDTAPHN